MGLLNGVGEWRNHLSSADEGKVLFSQPDNPSSLPSTQAGSREPTTDSCPLITCVLWYKHVCTHTLHSDCKVEILLKVWMRLAQLQ